MRNTADSLWDAPRALTEEVSLGAVGADGSVYVMREDVFPNAAGRVTASMLPYAPDGSAGVWLEFPARPQTPAVDHRSDDPEPLPPQMRGRLELMAMFLGLGGDWRSTRWVPFAPRVVNEVGPDGARISGRASTKRGATSAPSTCRKASVTTSVRSSAATR